MADTHSFFFFIRISPPDFSLELELEMMTYFPRFCFLPVRSLRVHFFSFSVRLSTRKIYWPLSVCWCMGGKALAASLFFRAGRVGEREKRKVI
jgi:hypothetical protein